MVREYLQARILEALQAKGVFTRWAFLGGTALRFLYDLPRYSEELDFSLRQPGLEVGLADAVEEARRVLTRETYAVESSISEGRTVAAAQIQFPGLLDEFGLSPHASQKLTIRLEVDTSPPAGAEFETALVRRHVVLRLCHYDRASLLAGKLHAVLARPRPR